MGAQPYDYVVPYEPDLQAALDRLRQRVFESGEFNGAEENPATIEEAFEIADADGTRSILDILAINDTQEMCTASPVSEEELREFFGTDKPTRAMVEEGSGEIFARI